MEGVDMGQAREVMDRLTEAAMKGDFDTLASLHADDAVSVTPDQGELVGRQQAVDYLMGFRDAFPDLAWESLHSHESGDTAIDEGYVIGTHTQTLQVPGQEPLPATGKSIRIRSADAITVRGGQVASHRYYFDQFEFLGQLGMLPEM